MLSACDTGTADARKAQPVSFSAYQAQTAALPRDAVAKARVVSASMFYAKPYADRLGDVVDAVHENGVEVVTDRNVPLEAFDDAWSRLASHRSRGKIVVSVT